MNNLERSDSMESYTYIYITFIVLQQHWDRSNGVPFFVHGLAFAILKWMLCGELSFYNSYEKLFLVQLTEMKAATLKPIELAINYLISTLL